MRPVDFLYRKKRKDLPYNESLQIYCAVPFSHGCWLGKLPAERISLKTWLTRAWFKIITRGNLSIYYTTNSDGAITHTSYVVGKCFKFPFLNENDYEIGPCFTHPQYRGQGIYPMVLDYITQTKNGNHFYMLVHPTNTPSIRGIEKAGFNKIGKVKKTKIGHCYMPLFSSSHWRYYNHALVPDNPPYIPASSQEINAPYFFSNENGYVFLCRWIEGWDFPQKMNWWYCIKDTPWQVEKASKKARYEVRKALKNFYIRLINPKDYTKALYEVQRAASLAYPAKYRPHETFEQFCQKIQFWQFPHVCVYGAFSIKENNLVGYAVLNDYQHYVNFTALKVTPAYEKQGINAALVHGVLEALNPRMFSPFFISDGSRAINHQTHFQDYLEKYFGFRKAYCKLRIKYRPGLDKIIKIIYPFRRFLFGWLDGIGKIHQLNAILKMEEICRADANIEVPQ